MADDEELRAIAYRREKRTQLASHRSRDRAMAGSALERIALAERWQPLIAAGTPIDDVPSIEDDIDQEDQET